MTRRTLQALLAALLLTGTAGAARPATAHGARNECRGSLAAYSWGGPHGMFLRIQVSRICATPSSVPRPEVVTSLTCRNDDPAGPRDIAAYPTAVLPAAARTFMLRGTGAYVVGGISYAGTPVTLRGRFVARGIRATLTASRCLDAGPFRIFVRRVR